MQKGIRPGTEKRCALLKTMLERGIEASSIDTSLMRGKTEEEKEQIAEELLQKLTI